MHTFLKTMSYWGKVSGTGFSFRVGFQANRSVMYIMICLNKVSFVVCLYTKQVKVSQIGQNIIVYTKLSCCILLFVLAISRGFDLLCLFFCHFSREKHFYPIFFGRFVLCWWWKLCARRFNECCV